MSLPTSTEIEYLTTAQVAREYGVCVETVRNWIRKGVIGYVMIGPYRLKRITRTEADRHFLRVPGAR